MGTLAEEKNRLEVLCKRFKVQLTDTRKLLSATKTTEAATAMETAKSSKEEAFEAKTTNLMHAENTENHLKVVAVLSLVLIRDLINFDLLASRRIMTRKIYYSSSSPCSREN